MMTEKQPERQLIRLDKWLWIARFYKTRAIAREMINAGKVYYNQVQAKPGRSVEVGAEIRLRQGLDEKTVIVLGMAPQRLAASLATLLYQETSASLDKRQKLAAARQANALFITFSKHKPDKKVRRQLNELKSRRRSGELN